MVGLHQIVTANVITCLEPLLNCQCSLTVAEINIKKHRNKTYKTLKMQKDVGMACQKGRDGIVNLQSPIPTSFTLQLQTNVKTMQG